MFVCYTLSQGVLLDEVSCVVVLTLPLLFWVLVWYKTLAVGIGFE